MRYKVAIRFSVGGDLRFISHHDTMRLFERALARAALPIRFSEGFNPRPKLSLPLPRAVGVASDAEMLVVESNEPVQSSEVLARLTAQMPSGVRLTGAQAIEPKGSVQPVQVKYALELPDEQADAVAKALSELREAQTWPIERPKTRRKGGRTLDLKAYLLEADVARSIFRWTVRVDPQGTPRPAEVLAAVGLEAEAWLHRVCRQSVVWTGLIPAGSPDTSGTPDDGPGDAG